MARPRSCLAGIVAASLVACGGPPKERPKGDSSVPPSSPSPSAPGSIAAPVVSVPPPPAPLGTTEPPGPPPGPGVPPGELGTPGTITLERVAPDGRWLVGCQARADTNGDGKISVSFGQHGDTYGDALRPYLFTGAGAGRALEDFVGSDPTGRWLAFLSGGHLVLYDARDGKETDLTATDGALGGGDAHPFGPHRAASFADGNLLFLRRGTPGPRLAVRALDTGATRDLDTGEGVLWRVEPAPGGAWAFASVLTKDTNGDGKIEPPVPRTNFGGRSCRGPVGSYSTGGGAGDKPERRLVALGGASAPRPAEDPRRVGFFGAHLLLREADGALVLESTAGAREPFVPAACGGWVRGVFPAQGVIVVSCDGLGGFGGAPIHVVRRGKADLGTPIGSDSARSKSEDFLSYAGSRLASYGGGTRGDFFLFDMQTGKPHRRIAGWREDFASFGAFVLSADYADLGRGYDLQPVTWYDLDHGTSRAAAFQLAPKVQRRTGGPWLAIEEKARSATWLVIDVRDGALKGRVDGPVLAVATTGEVLTGAGMEAPLRWRKP